MRSLGDMPRIVIVSEVLGMLLLVVAYLSINDFVSLPGSMGDTDCCDYDDFCRNRPDGACRSLHCLARSQWFWSTIRECR